MGEIGWLLIESLIKGLFILTMILMAAAILVYMERKVSAWIQMRVGPNRVGPFGLLQPFADVIKLFMKEDITPKAASPFFHKLAPIISLGIAIAIYGVVPLAEPFVIGDRVIQAGFSPDVNIGVLFVLAMTSVGVYGIALAGWSSNNKYSLLGGLRSAAQMISYELSMGLSVVAIIMMTGSLSLVDIVNGQAAWEGWRFNLAVQPIAFIIFLVSSFAETNRAPFDLPEAEPELVGGFNTEYTGMKFGMFFLAEYGNMMTAALIISLLFLGGWNIPFGAETWGLQPGHWLTAIVQFLILLAKIGFMCFFFIWVRWSVPRFRYDQLMNLGWKVLLPLSLVNIALTAIGVYVYNYFAL